MLYVDCLKKRMETLNSLSLLYLITVDGVNEVVILIQSTDDMECVDKLLVVLKRLPLDYSL